VRWSGDEARTTATTATTTSIYPGGPRRASSNRIAGRAAAAVAASRAMTTRSRGGRRCIRPVSARGCGLACTFASSASIRDERSSHCDRWCIKRDHAASTTAASARVLSHTTRSAFASRNDCTCNIDPMHRDKVYGSATVPSIAAVAHSAVTNCPAQPPRNAPIVAAALPGNPEVLGVLFPLPPLPPSPTKLPPAPPPSPALGGEAPASHTKGSAPAPLSAVPFARTRWLPTSITASMLLVIELIDNNTSGRAPVARRPPFRTILVPASTQ
jgi:hypothetical protein